MLVNLSWLKEFVPYATSVEDLCTALTQRGLEVDGVTEPFKHLYTVFIGEVLRCEKHATSEKLSVCTVSMGDSELTIVCGAKNVSAGIKVPVAVVGTIMLTGVEIKETILRGVSSCGMICSEAELGLGEGTEGIWILPEDAPIGENLADYLSIRDTVLEISITPNRADCLSILGIAREVALYYSLPITMPSVAYTSTEGYEEICNILVNEELVPFYCTQVIDGFTDTPTPSKIYYRLLSVGIRPISLVVDITNYVMIELGQPLHAFDANTLVGEALQALEPEKEETTITLDGIERTINVDDICIYDSNGIVAIAGVMGCKHTAITKNTVKIVFEAAVFNAISVRRTAKHLGISSQASYRFERGVDKGNTEFALARAISLLRSIVDIKISPLITKTERPHIPASILFRPSKVRDLLGIVIDDNIVFTMLESLECFIEKCDSFWKVTAPSYRIDLLRENDFIEEIARLYGMDSIPIAMPAIYKNPALEGLDIRYRELLETKRIMQSFGLNEVVSYSFVPATLLDELSRTKKRVALKNPLSEEYNVLRTDIMPSLLMALQRNLNRSNVSLGLFEVGKVFLASDESQDVGVEERDMLGIILYGKQEVQEWGASTDSWGYREIKSIITNYFQNYLQVEASYVKEDKDDILLPSVGIFIKGEKIGTIGRFTPDIASRFDAKEDIWYAEIALYRLLHEKKNLPVIFEPLPSYPSISRDITCILGSSHTVGMIFDVIKAMKLSLLEKLSCIDIYEPQNTADKHVTVRVVFRDAIRTLTDKEADEQRDAIVETLIRELSVSV